MTSNLENLTADQVNQLIQISNFISTTDFDSNHDGSVSADEFNTKLSPTLKSLMDQAKITYDQVKTTLDGTALKRLDTGNSLTQQVLQALATLPAGSTPSQPVVQPDAGPSQDPNLNLDALVNTIAGNIINLLYSNGLLSPQAQTNGSMTGMQGTGGLDPALLQMMQLQQLQQQQMSNPLSNGMNSGMMMGGIGMNGAMASPYGQMMSGFNQGLGALGNQMNQGFGMLNNQMSQGFGMLNNGVQMLGSQFNQGMQQAVSATQMIDNKINQLGSMVMQQQQMISQMGSMLQSQSMGSQPMGSQQMTSQPQQMPMTTAMQPMGNLYLNTTNYNYNMGGMSGSNDQTACLTMPQNQTSSMACPPCPPPSMACSSPVRQQSRMSC